jgi:hypothetical protein
MSQNSMQESTWRTQTNIFDLITKKLQIEGRYYLFDIGFEITWDQLQHRQESIHKIQKILKESSCTFNTSILTKMWLYFNFDWIEFSLSKIGNHLNDSWRKEEEKWKQPTDFE